MKPFQLFNDKNEIREEDMFMILSHRGILYYGNMFIGEIKWYHDTHKIPYKALQHGVEEYVDVGEDDDALYFYSRGS
ncbi:hypothetical protein Tco_1359237, partial [Tanacetum coccineum]